MARPMPDIPPTPTARRLAALALIGAGVAAGIGQVVLLRELMNIAAGNELTIGLMLAGWFLWGAGGAAWVGRRAAQDRHAGDALERVASLAVLPPVVLPFAISLVRVMPVALSRLPGGMAVATGEVMGLPHLVAVSLVTVLPAALLAGAQFAAGLALYTRLRPDATATGRAYAVDACGHLGGGVLTALLLTWGVGSLPLAALAGVASLAGVIARLALVAQYRSAGLIVALLVLAFGVHFSRAMDLSPLRLKGQQPLAEIETPHGSLGVVRWGERGVYFYSNGVPAFPSPPTPALQHLVHFPVLQLPRPPQRLLLIGGGAAGGLHEVLQYGPQVQVDYVELDPGLIRLARQYLVGRDRAALEDPRVHVWAMDGRLWVKQRGRRGPGDAFDVVILGVPEPSTAQVNRFYTVDFLREVAATMKPEGVLGLQVPSSETYLGDELLRLDAVVVRTVRQVFPQVALLPGDPMVIAATRQGHLTENAEVLRRRLDALRVDAPDFRAHAWDRLFPFEVRQVRETLDAAPPLPLNTDAQPIGFFYGQAYWVAQHSRSSWAVFEGLSRLRGRHVLALLALLGVAGCVAITVSRHAARMTLPLAVLGTGWIAMALEVTLLFGFQVYYGYVYQQLGVITGAFMVGLAWGALQAAKWTAARGAKQAWNLLVASQLALLVEALLLPHLLRTLSALQTDWALALPIAFPLATALVGLAVGAQFPVAARLMSSAGEAQAGARLYAADLIGACLGSVVAGAMLLPVLGIVGTCVTAAAVSGLLAVLIVAARARGGGV